MDKPEKNYRFDTLTVRAGYTAQDGERTSVLPIYQSNAYVFDSVQYAAELFSLSRGGNIYSRLTNPTVAALEEKVNALEGGVGALAMASGHAVIFNTILNLACAGDEIISSRNIYGGAVNMLGVSLGNIGIATRFVDPDDLSAWEAAVTDKTRAMFVEIVGNPHANVADLEKIAEIAHRHGIPLIADSTFTTPYLIRPIEFGADLVVHSATKFLNGHGNSMCGIVVDSGKFAFDGNVRFPLYNQPDRSYHGLVFAKDCGDAGFITRLRALLLRDLGACLSPFNAFLTMQGMETLALRMRRHCDNALTVARFLKSHPAVTFVNYPSLEGDKYHALAQKYLPGGAGSVLTFGLSGGREAGERFINSLKLFMHAANLGDTRSMVSHPASTTHSQLSDRQLLESGITPDTVRLSVGIEDPDDLTDDLRQAIQAATGQ